MFKLNGVTKAAAAVAVGAALIAPAAAQAHDRRATDAVVGGLVGALAGGLIGGDATGAVVGAGAGALLGAAVAGHGHRDYGYGYGYGRYDGYRDAGYGRPAYGYGGYRGGYGEVRTDYRTGGYGYDRGFDRYGYGR